MKTMNLLLGILIVLIGYSCTSDYVDRTENSKSIFKLKADTYYLNEIDRSLTRIYENNKPKTDSFYDSNNSLTYYFNWIYSNNILISKNGYDANGNLTNALRISYDDMNRITQIIDSGFGLTQTTITNFTYNSDNTITSISEVSGVISNKTFFLNSSGLIYKEVNDNEIIEAAYDSDYNIISKTGFENANYFYDDINLPPENFPIGENFIFGSSKTNYIIQNNSINAAVNNDASILPKFATGYQSEMTNLEIEWELDDNNYPINRKLYIQNQLNIDYKYIYNE
jgi:hypothetical protein